MQPLASDKIIYEHPLNEKTRTLMRLEHLFRQVSHHTSQPDIWSSRAAIESLLDMASIFSRADIKTELIKEIKRHRDKLNGIQKAPEVNIERLDQIVAQLNILVEKLQRLNGQIGRELRENEFLQSIAQRSSIPGGSCAFDLPAYHYWLQQPAVARKSDLQAWASTLEPIDSTVTLLLSLIRGSTHPSREKAEQGFFQQNMDPQSPSQIIRVGLPRETRLLAEISGGRHRFTIRFMEHLEQERPTQSKKNITFFLNCCIL